MLSLQPVSSVFNKKKLCIYVTKLLKSLFYVWLKRSFLCNQTNVYSFSAHQIQPSLFALALKTTVNKSWVAATQENLLCIERETRIINGHHVLFKRACYKHFYASRRKMSSLLIF